MYPLYVNLNDGEIERYESDGVSSVWKHCLTKHTLMHTNISVHLIRAKQKKKKTNENIWYFRMNSWHFRQNGILKALDSLYLREDGKMNEGGFRMKVILAIACCCCCCCCCFCCCGGCFEFFCGHRKMGLFACRIFGAVENGFTSVF